MKIGLYDVDSRIPNLALMKLSAYHKKKGDDVSFYSPLFQYDKVYASKIFTKSDQGYLKKNMIIGGSGFDLKKKLPNEIEHIYPDYSLYKCNYAIGFITRGCIRKCEFCIVPKKEGLIKKNADLEEFTKKQEEVKLLDNNILAYKNHLEELEKLRDSEKKIDFNQGLDIRLINNKNAKLLSEIKRWTGLELRFAFDNINLESIITKKTEILKRNGIKRGRFYMLINFNTSVKEDIKRVEILEKLGHRIYPMPYLKNEYSRLFIRWVRTFSYKQRSFDDFIKLWGRASYYYYHDSMKVIK